MIHEIARELAAQLVAKGCPIRVVDGPEQTSTSTYGNERIVLEHDEQGGDSFTPPRSQSGNPKLRRIRMIGATLTIYAQSPANGSLPFEHRRRAEHVLDLVLVALDRVFAERKNAWLAKSGAFVQPDDLAASERIGGAVYRLSLAFERGVFDRTWTGAAAGEFTILEDSIGNTTTVSHPGA